jgi:predicted CoA-binding protein
MANEACPIPSEPERVEAGEIEGMLEGKRIAVVGLSDSPARASYGVGAYLKEQGYEVVPVNPNHSQVMGMKCYASLREVPGKIDVVDVFRRAEFCAEVVREAIEVGAKGVWLQVGIRSDEGRKLAREAGIYFVEDRCLMVEHMRRGGGRKGGR